MGEETPDIQRIAPVTFWFLHVRVSVNSCLLFASMSHLGSSQLLPLRELADLSGGCERPRNPASLRSMRQPSLHMVDICHDHPSGHGATGSE